MRAYVGQEYGHVGPARFGEMEVLAAMMDTAIERAARAGIPRSALLADDALEIAASRLLALDLMERDSQAGERLQAERESLAAVLSTLDTLAAARIPGGGSPASAPACSSGPPPPLRHSRG